MNQNIFHGKINMHTNFHGDCLSGVDVYSLQHHPVESNSNIYNVKTFSIKNTF